MHLSSHPFPCLIVLFTYLTRNSLCLPRLSVTFYLFAHHVVYLSRCTELFTLFIYFSRCARLLDNEICFQEKYAKDLADLNNHLKLAQSEKKQIALKFVEIQSDLNESIMKNERLEQNLTKIQVDNSSLNENLIENNKRLLQTESILNDLLELSKDVLQKKTRDEQFEDQKRDALESRLRKFEIKHQQIKEENRKLKSFKANAFVKLKQAKHYLSTEDI